MKHKRIRSRVIQLSRDVNARQWDLAQLLNQVSEDGLHKEWGYSAFGAYVKAELDFSVRYAQYLCRVWNWHLTLPPAGQAWARQLSMNVLRRFVSEIHADNWREWRRILKGVSAKRADEMRREIVQGRFDLGRAARVRNVAKATAGMPLVDRMCAMRTKGLSAQEVADTLGVSLADVRATLRLLQIYVPLDVYECIRAHDGMRHVESELLQVVLEWYAGPIRKTGTDGRAS